LIEIQYPEISSRDEHVTRNCVKLQIVPYVVSHQRGFSLYFVVLKTGNFFYKIKKQKRTFTEKFIIFVTFLPSPLNLQLFRSIFAGNLQKQSQSEFVIVFSKN
jgi:hypothetical protein